MGSIQGFFQMAFPVNRRKYGTCAIFSRFILKINGDGAVLPCLRGCFAQ
jgi:hypothetical protein